MDYSNDPMARLFVDLTKKVGDAMIGLAEVFDGQYTFKFVKGGNEDDPE